jgi:hypothetical protein
MADNKDRHEITKPLMAQIDRDRRFHGTIHRDSDSDGHPLDYGRI